MGDDRRCSLMSTIRSNMGAAVNFDNCLSSLSQFRELVSLTLASIPAPCKLSFLPDVARNCPRLKHLSLSHIGLTGACDFIASLIQSCCYLEKLEDLRFCKKLARVTIFCQYELLSKDASPTLLDTVKELPNLYVFQLFSDTTTAFSNMISKNILSFMKARHPGAHVLLLRMFGSDPDSIVAKLNFIPFIHWHEMTCLYGKVFP